MRKTLRYAVTFAAILVVWQLVSLLGVPFIPPPVAVLANPVYSQMVVHAGASLWRIAAGLAAAVALGVPLGLAMGYSPVWDRRLSPLVYFTYPIPKIALLPLVMLIFGLGDFSKIVMIMLIVVFQVIVAMRDAARGIPKETFYALISLGARRMQMVRLALLPATLPSLLTSVRVSLGTALSVLFFTETFGTRHGMGYFIMDAWMRVDYTDMLSGIVALGVLGVLLFALLDALERALCRWNR